MFNPIYLTEEYFDNRPNEPESVFFFGKGGGSPDQEQEALEAEEVSFDTTLQGIFSSQYATQQKQLAFLQGQLEPQIASGGQGYTPTQLTNQRTEATDVNSEQYQQAQQALNQQVSAASGGSKLAGVAGATQEDTAELLSQEAQTQAGSQEQITQNNANLQQTNYWNAINALNGVAAEENPLGYAQASSSASEASSAASEANSAHIQATSSPLMGALGGALGGVGSAAGGIWSFWFASILDGWFGLRTFTMRLWLRNEAPKWFFEFYKKNALWVSKTPLRYTLLPVAWYVLEKS